MNIIQNTVPLSDLDYKRIAFAGDWHGQIGYAKRAVEYAVDHEAEVIIHVGDFGLWKTYANYVHSLQAFAMKKGIIILFIDGNHEDFTWLNSFPISNNGLRKITDNIWHIPRATRWEWNGVKYLALGGAVSIDQMYRTPGNDWFPEEAITYMDVENAISGGKTDVLITHDSPDGSGIEGIGATLPDDIQRASDQSREFLGVVVDETTPHYLFHGHYHVRESKVRNNSDGSTTRVECLDRDTSPLRDNLFIADMSELLNE